MDNFSNFDLMAVANGYILRVGFYQPGMVTSKENEFVFETFESLVKFLNTHLEKPIRETDPLDDTRKFFCG